MTLQTAVAYRGDLKITFVRLTSDGISRAILFSVPYALTDYHQASDAIIRAATGRESYTVSALAVHGLVETLRNPRLAMNLSRIDLIVPDGQPIRWALNSFYGSGLKDRVYGPKLTETVLAKASALGLRVFLFGSTETTLLRLRTAIGARFPGVVVCGAQADRFRDATESEDAADIRTINASDAHIVLVGRGCPRQEIWVAEHKGKIASAMLAVGAAFDFIAGTLPQAPQWMQNRGLEWLYRLISEPRRLWKRYLVTNSVFIYLFMKHRLVLRDPKLVTQTARKTGLS